MRASKPKTSIDAAGALLDRLVAAPPTRSADPAVASALMAEVPDRAGSPSAALETLRATPRRGLNRALARRSASSHYRNAKPLARTADAILHALTDERHPDDAAIALLQRTFRIAPVTAMALSTVAAAQLVATPAGANRATSLVVTALRIQERAVADGRAPHRRSIPSQALHLGAHALLTAHELPDATRRDTVERIARVDEASGAFDRAYHLYGSLGDSVGLGRVVDAFARHLLESEQLAIEARARTGAPTTPHRIPIDAVVTAASTVAKSPDDWHLLITAGRHATGTLVPTYWQRCADAYRAQGEPNEAARIEAMLNERAVGFFDDGDYAAAAEILHCAAASTTASPERKEWAATLADRLSRMAIGLGPDSAGR